MRKTTLQLLILTMALIVLPSFSSLAQKMPKVAQFTLNNGLTVYLNEDHTQPEVFGLVITKAGAKNDPANATGMAHYMEHMLFKGTETIGTTNWEKEKPHIDRIFELYDSLGTTQDEDARKAIQMMINQESKLAGEYAILNETSAIINQMGGTNLNAGTGPDQTVFYNAFPPSQIEKWVELYSERFYNPVFRQFQAELEVVYEEKNMYSDMFFMNIYQAFLKEFFKNHPYGQQTTIGTIEHLKNPSLTKMREFFQTYYVPNNMALVISGDFDTREVKPMIVEKFAKWENKPLPEPKTWEEKAFSGREEIEVKLSPVKIGLLGYRTVPFTAAESPVFEVITGLLNNSTQTGLLDELTTEGKVMAAQAMQLPYQDHGGMAFMMVPKILGQKLPEAEQLVLEQVNRLKTGDFEDWLLDAAKLELSNNLKRELETNEGSAMVIATAFNNGKSLESAFQHAEKIQEVTKADIQRIAKTYFGDNYLAFFSKMGFPKTPKIEKPGFEAVASNTKAKSPFLQKMEQMQSPQPEYKTMDFNQAVSQTEVVPGLELWHSINPKNQLFSLELKYGIGDYHLPLLTYATLLMDYAGAEAYTPSELRQQLAQLGCSIYASADSDELSFSLEGPEQHLEPALKLMNAWVNHPVATEKEMANVLENVKGERKMEANDPAGVANALTEYLKYGEQSSFLCRPSLKDFKKMDAETLLAPLAKARQYSARIFYCGQLPAQQVQQLLKKEFEFTNTPKESIAPFIPERKQYTQNQVVFVPMKKASQAQIYFMVNGAPFNKANRAQCEAFNLYFGGGFSGLVLQEIREYRSMAYSAGAGFRLPGIKNAPVDFTGFIGTQADKCTEAINIFNGLVREMPEKPERMDMIKDYLQLSMITKTPDFRARGSQIARWKAQGYQHDPSIDLARDYTQLEFDDIVDYYQKNLQNKSVLIAIVGNKKRINTKTLSAYGPVKTIKMKDLYQK